MERFYAPAAEVVHGVSARAVTRDCSVVYGFYHPLLAEPSGTAVSRRLGIEHPLSKPIMRVMEATLTGTQVRARIQKIYTLALSPKP